MEESNSYEHAKPVLLFKRREKMIYGSNITKFYCSIIKILKYDYCFNYHFS